MKGFSRPSHGFAQSLPHSHSRSATTRLRSDEPSADQASATASTPAPADATARSDDGGVEVWDLTSDPTDETFGIEDPATSADYTGDEARSVRFELDGGSVELDLADLTFYHQGDVFAFLSRTAELPADQLAAAYRDLTEQLGVDAATADAFEADLAAASTDQAGQVSVSYPDEVRLGDWTLAISAAISPSVGTGVVTVSVQAAAGRLVGLRARGAP